MVTTQTGELLDNGIDGRMDLDRRIERWLPRPLAARGIEDWFDPDDDRHLVAYEQYQRTGTWPEGFLPEGIDLAPGWDSGLAHRIARRWLRHREDLRFRAEGAE